MTIQERLINKGIGQPRLGLIEQGKVSVAQAKAHEGLLAAAGWSSADTDAMSALVTELEGDVSVQADHRASSHAAHSNEQAGIDHAKAFVRRLSLALPRVLRNTQTGLTDSEFAIGENLQRMTPKIVGYLTRIRPHVQTLDSELAPAFEGKSALAELDRVKGELDGADAHQETTYASLPADTAKLYETKGKLLEAIQDLNRAGKIAFDGDSTKLALWNKDIVVRARKSRAKPAAPVQPTAHLSAGSDGDCATAK